MNLFWKNLSFEVLVQKWPEMNPNEIFQVLSKISAWIFSYVLHGITVA